MCEKRKRNIKTLGFTSTCMLYSRDGSGNWWMDYDVLHVYAGPTYRRCYDCDSSSKLASLHGPSVPGPTTSMASDVSLRFQTYNTSENNTCSGFKVRFDPGKV